MRTAPNEINGGLAVWKRISVVGGAIMVLVALVSTVIAVAGFFWEKSVKRAVQETEARQLARVDRLEATLEARIGRLETRVAVADSLRRYQIAMLARAQKDANIDRRDLLLERVVELGR